jgi:uncharacterized protein YbaR (Trm112 family)
MQLDPMLLEVLRCPCEHHSPVTTDDAASTIVCVRCATTFPVRDDIPVMLIDEATPGPHGIGGVAPGKS